MIKFNVDSKKHVAVFVHLMRTNERPYAATLCDLYEGDGKDGYLVGHGQTICVPQDNYSRIVGRKLSFGRALKAAGLTKEQRQAAWEQFMTQCKWKS